MMPFVARSRVLMREVDRHAARIAHHVADHDFRVRQAGDERRIEFSEGHTVLICEADALTIVAAAQTLAALEDQKYFLASHLGELVLDQKLDIVWTGAGEALTPLPNFRVLKVVAVRDLGPRMRRITFRGENLERFDTLAQLHVKLLIPPRGRPAAWPRLARSGRIEWPDGDARLMARKYTIRHIDVAGGTLDIDFVVHGDAGPGTAFARAAEPGDPVGMMGPGGLGMRPADWYLLAGDETALPAIARIVEGLPVSARGSVLIEVTDGEDEQPFNSSAELDIRWLHRGKHDVPGDRLMDAVRAVDWPSGSDRIFAWLGCEQRAAQDLRGYLRREKGLPKDASLAVAYWRADEAVRQTREES